jgi:hypothetical protein
MHTLIAGNPPSRRFINEDPQRDRQAMIRIIVLRNDLQCIYRRCNPTQWTCNHFLEEDSWKT